MIEHALLTWSAGQGSDASQLILKDRHLLQSETPRMIRTMSLKGLDEGAAPKAIAWSWYAVRRAQAPKLIQASITLEEIQTKALKMGRLLVSSQPSGADIYVDTRQWPTPTNGDGFADEGKRNVRVQLGSLIASAECAVKPGAVVRFSATLAETGSKASCQ